MLSFSSYTYIFLTPNIGCPFLVIPYLWCFRVFFNISLYTYVLSQLFYVLFSLFWDILGYFSRVVRDLSMFCRIVYIFICIFIHTICRKG